MLLHRRGLGGLLAGGAFLGSVAGGIAWRAEGAGCATLLRRGEVRSTLVPLDPPPVEQGRVEAEVVDAGCRGTVRVRWPMEVAGRGSRVVQVGVPVRVRGSWYPRPEGPFGRPGGTLIVKEATPSTQHPVPSTRRRLLAISAELYGDRAPLVDALLLDRQGAI
ncbi:MAG TPA: hypothetical protein VG712_05840, partial [Gemmatimonadales bacterium]|nr:hypothetical protein [Gemmatimonadales bacterium]